MIIKLNELINKSNLTFNYTEETLDSLNLMEGVRIEGQIVKDGEHFIVEGTYSTVLRLECVRCLVEITPLIQGEFRACYLEPKNYSKYLASLKPEEEFSEEHFEEATNNEINISELVREYIILDLSQYETCLPECKDTTQVDKYSKDDIDPRWQQLLDIKI